MIIILILATSIYVVYRNAKEKDEETTQDEEQYQPQEEEPSQATEEESTPTTPKYSLIDAINEHAVNAEFRGTGYCSGDSIKMEIEPEVDFEIEIELKPGWILINSGSGQNMIIGEQLTITVKPKNEIELKIEAYCLDIELDNPSSLEKFSLKNDTSYGQDVVKLMNFVQTAPEEHKSIGAVQIAVWVLLGNEAHIPISHSEEEVADAKWLLESTGIDISDRIFFRTMGKTEEEIAQLIEDDYVDSAKEINMVLTTEEWEITLFRTGKFWLYLGGNDFEKTIRVDLKVENLRSESTYFDSYGSALNTSEGLFDYRSYYETFSDGYISGGETSEGCMLFYDVPENASVEKIVIAEVYIFDIEHDETYTLMEMHENRFLQSAITVEETITKDDFSITLTRVGYFTHLQFETFGDETTDFRVDLIVTNVASEPKYLWTTDIEMVDNLDNTYAPEWFGSLELGTIEAGDTREGYIIFSGLDENATSVTVSVTYQTYPDSVKYEYTVNLP